MNMVMHRSTVPAELSTLVYFNENHVDRQVNRNVYMIARITELNMSLPLINIIIFWKQGQHLGKILLWQKTKIAIKIPMTKRAAKICRMFNSNDEPSIVLSKLDDSSESSPPLTSCGPKIGSTIHSLRVSLSTILKLMIPSMTYWMKTTLAGISTVRKGNASMICSVLKMFQS